MAARTDVSKSGTISLHGIAWDSRRIFPWQELPTLLKIARRCGTMLEQQLFCCVLVTSQCEQVPAPCGPEFVADARSSHHGRLLHHAAPELLQRYRTWAGAPLDRQGFTCEASTDSSSVPIHR